MSRFKTKRRKGSIFIVTGLGFLISAVLTTALVLSSSFSGVAKQIHDTTENTYNLLCLSELVDRHLQNVIGGFRLSAVDNPVKGDRYYDRLVESIRSDFVDIDGNLKGWTLEGSITALSLIDNSMRDGLLQVAANRVNASTLKITDTFNIDYFHEDTIIQYTTGDILVLYPMQVHSTLQANGIVVTTEYTISGLTLHVTHSAPNVYMTVDTSSYQVTNKLVRLT